MGTTTTAATLHQFLVSADYGGAAQMAVRLARGLAEGATADVRVWIPGEGRAARKVREAGFEPRSYDAAALRSARPWAVLAESARLGWALRQPRPGIVHIHSPLAWGVLWRPVRWSGLPAVVHVQIEEDEEGLRWALRRPPEVVVTCAAFLAGRVERCLPAAGRRPTRIVVAPNAVDVERFRPGDRPEAKRRIGAPTDRPLALMLANLAPHKGQETALRAVAALRERGIDLACWLAGVDREPGAPFESRLRGLVAELALEDRARLLGFRDDAPDLLRAADFLLLPSTHEGLPLVVLEAQASEVPVLAAPTAGIPEVIDDGETGFLIAADDVRGYADRLEALLRDPQAARSVAVRARRRCAEVNSFEAFQRRIEGIYGDLLAGGVRPARAGRGAL